MVFQEEIWQCKYRFTLVFQELFLILIVQVGREWASFFCITLHNLVLYWGFSCPPFLGNRHMSDKHINQTCTYTLSFHSGIFLTLQSSSWSIPAAKPWLAMLQQHLNIFMPTVASEGKDTAFVPILWLSPGRLTIRRFQYPTNKKKKKKFIVQHIPLITLLSSTNELLLKPGGEHLT